MRGLVSKKVAAPRQRASQPFRFSAGLFPVLQEWAFREGITVNRLAHEVLAREAEKVFGEPVQVVAAKIETGLLEPVAPKKPAKKSLPKRRG